MVSKNPYILLSVVNTKLRDKYKSLDDLLDDEDFSELTKEEIDKILNSINYYYNNKENQYKQGD